MKASDGRTHRRAIGSLRSFIVVRFARLRLERTAFGRNRHREEPQGVERRPSSTGYGDAAIQESLGALRSPGLLRFARNDDRVSKCNLLLAFALLALLTAPARADFRVCNKTHALANIAVGTDAGEVFKTEGWWVATPGSCATPIRGPLKSRYVYLYATDIDGVDLLPGTVTMCIDHSKFVAYGAENCWRRGLQAVTFAEIDTLDHLTGRRSDRPKEMTFTCLSSGPRSPLRTERLAAGSRSRKSRDSAPARADRARGSTARPSACAPRRRR